MHVCIFNCKTVVQSYQKERGSMLDINLFREEKGFDPEKVRESQRRRFASVELVDEIIHLDKELRLRKLFFTLL